MSLGRGSRESRGGPVSPGVGAPAALAEGLGLLLDVGLRPWARSPSPSIPAGPGLGWVLTC